MNRSAETAESIDEFLARYTRCLTEGDFDGLADIYNYPALAVTAITEPPQPRDFFRSSLLPVPAAPWRSRGRLSPR
jgi:hypothetical protein